MFSPAQQAVHAAGELVHMPSALGYPAIAFEWRFMGMLGWLKRRPAMYITGQ